MATINTIGKSWLWMTDEEFAEFIHRIIDVMESVRMEETDMSQRKLAEKLEIPQRTYSKLAEPNATRLPSSLTFLKFILFIGVERFVSEYNTFMQEKGVMDNDKK